MPLKYVILLSIFFLATILVLPIKKIFGQTRRVPEEFRDYRLIGDCSDSLFLVSRLKGSEKAYHNERNLYVKENGDYLLEVREHCAEGAFECYYFCISPAGKVLDVLKMPEDLYFERGYIVGKNSYCNWTTTGDTTAYQATRIAGEMSRDEFRRYYEKAEAVELFSKDVTFLMDGTWYCTRLDFWPGYSDEEFKNKGRLLRGDHPVYPTIIEPDYADRPYRDGNVLKAVPCTNRELSFYFFEKERHNKERSSVGWGNPTGGRTTPELWAGVGYFALKFPEADFCFKRELEYVRGFKDEWAFELSLVIYKTDSFAIFADKYRIYLVQATNGNS